MQYGSCTRLSPSRWLSRISLPFISADIAEAMSICPRCPRKAWISARSGCVEPMIASVDNDAVTTAPRTIRTASNRAASAQAVENCVPLISASPSFGPSTSGDSPTLLRADPPGRSSSSKKASPSPIITAAICANGARSPDAPTEPWVGIKGVTPRSSMASIKAQTSHLTPDAPRPSESSFSVIISCAVGTSSGSPTRSNVTGSNCVAASRCPAAKS